MVVDAPLLEGGQGEGRSGGGAVVEADVTRHRLGLGGLHFYLDRLYSTVLLELI